MTARRTVVRRPATRSKRIWLLAVPLAVFLAFFTAIAWAGPVPASPGSPGSAPSATAAVSTAHAEQPGYQLPTPAPSTATTAPTVAPTPTSQPGLNLGATPTSGSGGLLEPFDVSDQYGVPISAYTVNADTGDWTDIDLKIWDVFAQFFFDVDKWVIGFACWLVGWALDFGLAKIMIGPVTTVSQTIRDQLIDRIGLPGLFLVLAAFYGGYHIMFKNRSKGFAETGLSLLVAAVAATVLVSPAQWLLGSQGQPATGQSTMLLSNDGLLGQTRDVTLQISSMVLSEDPQSTSSDPADVSTPIKNALVDSMIVKPTELMLYGRTFTGNCAKAFGHVMLVQYNFNQLGLDPWTADMVPSSTGGSLMDQVQAAGNDFTKACKTGGSSPQAKKASADMAFSAAFVAVAAVIIAILIILVTGTFLIAQGWLAFEAIRGYWALTVGILPGGGRAVLWRWLSAITKAILAMMLSILFLAVFILMLLALIQADTGPILAVKFIVIDIAALAGLAGHKKIKEMSRQIAVNLNRRLANARVGGAGRSVFHTPGRYAESAPGLKQILGDAKGEARKISQPMAKAGRTARQMWVGPPPKRGKGGAAGRLRKVASAATTVAATVGTGGTAAAAKVAAQAAAKQTLKKKLADAAVNKMSQTRGGRATLATGKAAAATGKYGWKATKLATLATVGAPVGIPRGVKATKRGAAAAKVRTDQVKQQLLAAKDRAAARVDQKVDGAIAFKDEYTANVKTAGKFVGRQGAAIQLGMAQPGQPVRPTHPAGPRTVASAPRVPGPVPKPPRAAGPAAGPSSPARTPGTAGAGASAPTAPTAPVPAAAPAPKPRARRRAQRPAGPPAKS